ncbi:MAG: diacylglycerol kinase family protein [Patescibacteria group bacterium]|nr:diacylglycerol kinase family protein [Patescibacteria group bacterium]
MHIYLYDSFLKQKKFDHILAQVETRTTDLGLNGKIIRMGAMNSVLETIENEIKKGAKTITAVGNNSLINKIINSMASVAQTNMLAKNIPLGIIPVGKKNNNIAGYLGIPFEEAACDVLSARRIQELDLGLANNSYFLTHANITSMGTLIEIDKNYSIEIKGAGEINVINLPANIELPKNANSSAQDSLLELYIKTPGIKKFMPLNTVKNSESIFPFDELTIINKNHPVIIDGSTEIKTPVKLVMAKEKIKIIVGKNRNL